MDFSLNYRGELKSNGNAKDKHKLRRHFHAQLAELWRQPPLVRHPYLTADPPEPHKPSLSTSRGVFRFVPLVSTRLYGVVDLDVILLRPGPPGQIIRGGGDIDNRLKTLFDALRVPEKSELPSGANPDPDENPFFCLCEDDKLITGVKVKTDRLLDPSDEREVLLILRVVTQHTARMWGIDL